jgi:AcrR family transcriptional regulator
MQEKRAARKRRNGVAAAPGGGSPPNRLELVHEAARAHFSSRGYEAASMREIAADAGINIATLYFYCSTKEQLLFDVLQEAMLDLLNGFRSTLETAGPTWTDKLTAAIEFHVGFCAERAFGTTMSMADLHRLTDEHQAEHFAARDEYDRELRAVLQEGIDAGEFRPLDAKLVTFAIIGIGLSAGRWYRPNGPLTPKEIAAQYVDMILGGLTPR